MRFLFVLFLSLLHQVSTAQKINILTGNCSQHQLQSVLTSGYEWVKFPQYNDREAWGKIKGVYRASLIEKADKALRYQWKLIPATAYLEYTRSGDRRMMQNPYESNVNQLKILVLAELVEGKGRYLDQIINGVWTICEMSSWSLSAHLSLQKAGLGLPDISEPVIDIGVGRTANLVAWINFFFNREFDKINPLISKRIKTEVTRQVLQPYYAREDFWWMGFKNESFVNNWNVWVNYNVLNCILLLEHDPEKRLYGIYKTMRSVDKFMNYYKADGGCDEGPEYWENAGGKLFQYLNLLSGATAGRINKFDHPLVQNIGKYIYKVYIRHPYYINFADAAAKFHHNPGLIFDYGTAIKDPYMSKFGSFLSHQLNWSNQLPDNGTIEDVIKNMFGIESLSSGEKEEPLIADMWLPDTEIMAARDHKNNTRGFYFAAKGGHNGESHNHNDVGSSLLYYNGEPVLIDVGSETYTRKTFGKDRYSIWVMRSAYHNIPLINGVEQKMGKGYKASKVSFSATKRLVSFSADIAGAYPESADVLSWIRSYELNRGVSFTIKDNYELKANHNNTALHFLTSCKVIQISVGLVRLQSANFSLDVKYNHQDSEVIVEPIEVKDKRLLSSWPPVIYRLVFKLTNKGNKGSNSIQIKSTINESK
jgi:hypothetical protein